MAIEGFDYKEFAASMSEQAKELVPPELQEHEKEYIIKTLSNFTMLAGEALYNDTSLNINADQAVFITQIIAEWSFHKSIDLIHSGILPQYWDGIMQKIAFTIFEVAKQAIIKNVPQDQLLQAVEHHVTKAYNQAIEELEKNGIIDEEIKNRAENQSNIDAMAKEAQKQQEELKKAQEEAEQTSRPPEPQRVSSQSTGTQVQRAGSTKVSAVTHKELKLMSLALVLKILSQDKVTTVLNKFKPEDSQSITQYMNMANLESQLDADLVIDCIDEIRNFLPVKKKLSKTNVIADLGTLFLANDREKIEKIIKRERPFVKKFIAQAYEGEYFEIPLKIAGIVAQYMEESI